MTDSEKKNPVDCRYMDYKSFQSYYQKGFACEISMQMYIDNVKNLIPHEGKSKIKTVIVKKL